MVHAHAIKQGWAQTLLAGATYRQIDDNSAGIRTKRDTETPDTVFESGPLSERTGRKLPHPHEFFNNDGDSLVDDIHEACLNSDFDAVTFDVLDPDHPDVLVVEADIGEFNLAIWTGPKTPEDATEGTWCAIDGMETLALNLVHEDLGLDGQTHTEDEWELIRIGISEMLGIYDSAAPFFHDRLMEARTVVLTALDEVAESALDARDEDDEDEIEKEPWERSFDNFTRQCRLGLMAGVSVDESPEVPGSLNISASVMDQVLHRPVRLKVFFRPPAAGGQGVPDHWMAIDDIEVLAHGVEDEDRAGLLIGFPQESRDHLLHAIDHLHSMVHSAVEVVIAKSGAPYEMAEHAGLPRVEEMEHVIGGMSASAVADALAALNGVARLYTGTLPSDH